MNSKKILKINNLGVEFTKETTLIDLISRTSKKIVKAVENVDLEINDGEIIGLVGESGSGKSSLIKALVGVNKIKNGKVIDPSQKINSVMDIGINDGKIIEITDNISIQDGKNIIQAENKYVSPGFIDIHVHVYWGISPWGIDVDTYCINNGVTTVVDAGSAGLETMNGFKKYVIHFTQFLH